MKLLVCDVEGTIFKATHQIDGTDYPSTMWQPIAAVLGDAAIEEERETHQRWDKGNYQNYMEWVRATIDIHRRYSLRKADYDRLIQQAEYNKGVMEFFQQLNRKEWIPVLISGGFQNLIRRAQNELDIEYGFGACEYFFDEQGYLEHYSLQPSDFEGKIHFVDTLLKAFGLNKKTDWVYVGDGKNDEAVARVAPLAFGINPHHKLRALSHFVEINSFTEIVPRLEIMGERIAVPKTADIAHMARSGEAKSLDEIGRLNQMIVRLKKENRVLKQKLNEQKSQTARKEQLQLVRVTPVDYEKTPRKPLTQLLRGLNVVFLGLNENRASYQRLENFRDLRVMSGIQNNFDPKVIKNADFLFVYKNCVAHSVVARAVTNASALPVCYLLEPTNNHLLENALANVLHRYLYE